VGADQAVRVAVLLARLLRCQVVLRYHFTEMCCGTEAGSYLRLIDSCITQRAQAGRERSGRGSSSACGSPSRSPPPWPSPPPSPRRNHSPPFFFFFTLVTGPRRSLSLKLSDTRFYAPQIRARLGTTARARIKQCVWQSFSLASSIAKSSSVSAQAPLPTLLLLLCYSQA